MLRVATERLYYNDSYLTEFDAQVVEISPDGRRVYLDRSAFYPSSGGQPHDFGWLGGQEVIDVIDVDDRITHLTASPVGTGPVTGKIHWPRRYDHMQQHTGQHLLSAVLATVFGFPTLSFHMGEEVSTIELGTKDLTDAQIDQTETRANEAARQAAPVLIKFEEAGGVEGLRKPSQRSGTLRIVEIEGLDKSACGGTHVRSLTETLPLQIRKLERVRGHVRLEFVCGQRAIARAKQDYRVAQELARQGAVPIDKLPEYFAALKQRLGDAEKEKQRLAETLAQREGAELYAAATPSADGLRRARWSVERIDEAVRAKALAYASGARSLVLVLSADGALIACSADAGVHAGAILKQTLAEFGGKGGGSATLAQGNLPEPACARALAGKLAMS
jgi:alanyl-tRNA synthetase